MISELWLDIADGELELKGIDLEKLKVLTDEDDDFTLNIEDNCLKNLEFFYMCQNTKGNIELLA